MALYPPRNILILLIHLNKPCCVLLILEWYVNYFFAVKIAIELQITVQVKYCYCRTVKHEVLS